MHTSSSARPPLREVVEAFLLVNIVGCGAMTLLAAVIVNGFRP